MPSCLPGHLLLRWKICALSVNLWVPNVEHGLEDIGRGVCSWIILSVEQAQLVDGQVHQRLDVQHAVLDDTAIFFVIGSLQYFWMMLLFRYFIYLCADVRGDLPSLRQSPQKSRKNAVR